MVTVHSVYNLYRASWSLGYKNCLTCVKCLDIVISCNMFEIKTYFNISLKMEKKEFMF